MDFHDDDVAVAIANTRLFAPPQGNRETSIARGRAFSRGALSATNCQLEILRFGNMVLPATVENLLRMLSMRYVRSRWGAAEDSWTELPVRVSAASFARNQPADGIYGARKRRSLFSINRLPQG